MFCIDFSFLYFQNFIFHKFYTFDNTQKTIYRTAKKKKHVISFSFTGRFLRAVVIITGIVCATIVCQVDNEGVFMFVEEVIVHLSLLNDLNVLVTSERPCPSAPSES